MIWAFFFSLPSPMCKRQGGTFPVVVPCFSVTWSSHVGFQLTLEQILLFHAAQHRGRSKAFSQDCLAKVFYRLGPFWCLEEKQINDGYAEKFCIRWGNRGDTGHIGEFLASGARCFQGTMHRAVPHEHIPVQKEGASKHPRITTLMTIFSLPALGTAQVVTD